MNEASAASIDLENTEGNKECLTWKQKGRISQVVGLTIEAIGPRASLGELCYIRSILPVISGCWLKWWDLEATPPC